MIVLEVLVSAVVGLLGGLVLTSTLAALIVRGNPFYSADEGPNDLT